MCKTLSKRLFYTFLVCTISSFHHILPMSSLSFFIYTKIHWIFMYSLMSCRFYLWSLSLSLSPFSSAIVVYDLLLCHQNFSYYYAASININFLCSPLIMNYLCFCYCWIWLYGYRQEKEREKFRGLKILFFLVFLKFILNFSWWNFLKI